jgi:xanthine dehydrogenase small subunit
MPAKIIFVLNNKLTETDSNPAITLADFLRYEKKLPGTKIACREGDCGACTIISGETVNNNLVYKNLVSCILPLNAAHKKHIVTIEGLSGDNLNPIQEEFLKQGATQCGFCTPGFINSLTSFFLSSPVISYEIALKYVAGNICRCTGYFSIKRAIKELVNKYSPELINFDTRTDDLIRLDIIPGYFKEIKARLINITDTKSQFPKDNSDFLISGGTDLYVSSYPAIKYGNVNFIESRGKEPVSETDNSIHLDASSTIDDILTSEIIKKYFPAISELEIHFGSKQIRNRATAAGNIINASPIGDFTIFLLSLGAEAVFQNGFQKREVLLKDLFLGYKKLDYKKDEILEEIIFRKPSSKAFLNFVKISRREHLDIASVNSGFFVEIESGVLKRVGISAGGVAPVPKFLNEVSAFLEGKTLSGENIDVAVNLAGNEIKPIPDARGSDVYKSGLMKIILKNHFDKLKKFVEKN